MFETARGSTSLVVTCNRAQELIPNQGIVEGLSLGTLTLAIKDSNLSEVRRKLFRIRMIPVQDLGQLLRGRDNIHMIKAMNCLLRFQLARAPSVERDALRRMCCGGMYNSGGMCTP